MSFCSTMFLFIIYLFLLYKKKKIQQAENYTAVT